jgi:hypothetical protein
MHVTKIVVLIRRKIGLSQGEFRDYYEQRHVPLALGFIRPFLLDYRRTYLEGEAGYADLVSGEDADAAAAGSFAYDCITEMWFRDAATLDAMFETLSRPEVRAALTEDENRFLDRDSVRVIRCEERRTVLA